MFKKDTSSNSQYTQKKIQRELVMLELNRLLCDYVVKELINNLFDNSRTLFCDNWYSSVFLAKFLLTNEELIMLIPVQKIANTCYRK